MKKTAKIAILFSALVGLTSVAQAADAPQWEIWTGSLATVNIGLSQSVTTISLFGPTLANTRVGYFFAPGLAFVLNPSFSTVSANSVTNTAFNIYGGFNYSFMPAEVENSPFIEAGAGINMTSQTTTNTNFAWYAALGKRFKIWDHVAYSPMVTFNMVNATATTTSLNIVPAQFSFTF